MGEKAYSEYMLIWQKIKLYLDDNDNEILTSVNYNIQYCQELLDKYI